MATPDWLAEVRRHTRSRPGAEGLAAMAAELGRGLRVVRVRRLGGGIGSATSAVDLRDRAGRVRRVVLKRYPPGDDTARSEWERLHVARNVGIPSPEPLGLDDRGRWFGCPSLVIERLPGRPLLQPPRVDAWVGEIARTIARIESYDPARVPDTLREPRRAWKPPPMDGWSPLYVHAVARVQAHLAAPRRARVLCHGDFHPGNLLFARGRLSGVADWSEARLGPRSFDLAYCRTEVALLHGVDTAERLRVAYEAEAGPAAPDLALWDLYCAIGARRLSHVWLDAYREQGLRGVTMLHLRARLRAFTSRALAAAG